MSPEPLNCAHLSRCANCYVTLGLELGYDTSVPDNQERVVRGPAYDVAFDERGKPTAAALGFARNAGLPVEQLQAREFQGKSYLTAGVQAPGQPALQALQELVPRLIAELKFPKTMYWDASRVTFPRPIRWLVGRYGTTVVNFEYAGVHSDRVTYRLRPLGTPRIELAGVDDYSAQLKANGIVAEPHERREAGREASIAHDS